MKTKPFFKAIGFTTLAILATINIHAQKASLTLELSANSLSELGFDDLKNNFLNQPSIRLNYNAKKFSFGIEGGLLEDKVQTLYDQYPEVFGLIADQNVRSDSWKSSYILAGPSFNIINKLGLRVGLGVKGGFNFLNSSPDYEIVDNATQLTYERFDNVTEKESKLLIKPSLDISFYPGGGPIGINFSAAYFNLTEPQTANSFGLDFSQVNLPNDIPDAEQIRKVLSRWEITDRIEEPKTNGLAFSAGISLKIGGTKKKEPKADKVIPEPKIEKPKKDKEIVADKPVRSSKREKKPKKEKVKTPKPEKVIAQVTKKPKKKPKNASGGDDGPQTKSAEEEDESSPCDCIETAQSNLDAIEVRRMYPTHPYTLEFQTPGLVMGAYAACTPESTVTSDGIPHANDPGWQELPGSVEFAHTMYNIDPDKAWITTHISGACNQVVVDSFDIPEVVECGALLGGITEPVLDLTIPDTTNPNDRVLINAEAKGDWILANNGWSTPTQSYELFTRWIPLTAVHTYHQATPTDSIDHTFSGGDLTTFGHMKAEYWVWEGITPVCRQIFDVYYSNDTTNTNIYAGESGEFEITKADGSGYDIVPGVPFSGTGVVWVPAIASTVALEFQDIKCDGAGRLLDGEILAKIDPSAPTVPLQWALGAISSTVEYDHDQVQDMMEWADSNLTDVPFLGTTGPLTPLADPAINMPMVLTLDTINDSRFAITEMIFEPHKSKFNAVVAMAAPAEWNATDMIGFKASGVPFHPTDIVSPPERIELVDTITIGNVNNDISFHFMTTAVPFDPLHQGCFIAWDDDGFSHFGIELEARFTRDWFTPLPDDGSSRSKVTLTGIGTAWNDILLTGDWPKSTIENAHNMTIEVDEMNLDLSDSFNPVDIDFPAVYDTIGVDTSSLWRGFYAKNIELGLPDSWETYDSTTHPVIGVSDMFIDDQGLTMHAYAYDVAVWDSIKISDLSASVDTITVDWQLGSLTEAHIQGKIGLPASHPDSMMNPLLYDGFFLDSLAIALDTSFSLPGPITDQSVFGLTINPSGPIYSDMLKGLFELEPTSQITAYKQDTVKHFSLLLDGHLKYIDKPLGSYFKLNMDIGFSGLQFDYNSGDTLGIQMTNPTWTFASPQKTANGFPLNINNITLNPLPKSGAQLYHGSLDFDVTFAIGDTVNSIAAGSSMGIEFEIKDSPADKLKFKPKYLAFDLDSLGINANLAAVNLLGYVTIDSDTTIFGKRFTGGLSAYFKGPSIGATVSGMFGRTDYGHPSKYRYWKVDAGVTFPTAVPFLPSVGFYGFSGGAYGNMELIVTETAPGSGVFTKSYLPNKGDWGFKAGATIGTVPMEDAFNADITLEASFSGGSGISYIGLEGLFGTNAKIIDRRLGKGKVNGSLFTFYDFPNKHFHLSALASINSPPITTPAPISLSFDIDGLTSDWYFKLGEPDYDPTAPELMNEVNLNFDSTGVGVNLYEYFMFGNSIPYPNGFTHKFRNKYHDVLGSYPGFGASVGSGGVDSNSELGKGMALGIGFQFEQEGTQHITGKYHLGYELEAGAEVNLSYMRYAGSCAGHNPIGTNGWRAKGNLGLYAKAAARVHKMDGTTIQKTWTIADLRAGAWITGEFPNPHYAAGAIDGVAQIGHWVGKLHPLGHWNKIIYLGKCEHYVDKYLLNINIHKEFEVGDKCNNAADNTTPVFQQENVTDDFDDILVRHVSPIQNFNYPETAPVVVGYNFVPDEPFHVSEQQGSGAIINRTFKLKVERSLKRKTSSGTWVNELLSHQVNDIGEYQYILMQALSAAPLTASSLATSGTGGVSAGPATLATMSGTTMGSPTMAYASALPAALSTLGGAPNPPPPPPPPLANTLTTNTYYKFKVTGTLLEYDYNTDTWSPAIKSDGTPLTDTINKSFRTGPMEPATISSGSLATY